MLDEARKTSESLKNKGQNLRTQFLQLINEVVYSQGKSPGHKGFPIPTQVLPAQLLFQVSGQPPWSPPRLTAPGPVPYPTPPFPFSSSPSHAGTAHSPLFFSTLYLLNTSVSESFHKSHFFVITLDRFRCLFHSKFNIVVSIIFHDNYLFMNMSSLFIGVPLDREFFLYKLKSLVSDKQQRFVYRLSNEIIFCSINFPLVQETNCRLFTGF